MNQRKEIRQSIESETTGERVIFHGLKYGRKWLYSVSVFGPANDYALIYAGENIEEARAVFSEYQREFELN
jgi:hypothetical protein